MATTPPLRLSVPRVSSSSWSCPWPQVGPNGVPPLDLFPPWFPGVIVYLDDLLIWADSDAEYAERLSGVLEVRSRSDCHLKASKCILDPVPVIEFLGYEVSEGSRPTTSRTAAFAGWAVPESKEDLLRFLGFTEYIRQSPDSPTWPPLSTRMPPHR